MKSKIITLPLCSLFVCLGMCFAKQAAKPSVKDSSASMKSDEKNVKAVPKESLIIIEARLLEIPSTPPPNDLYNYVYIMKYRVLKVLSGNCSEKTILVGHYNPLIPRQKIKDKMDKWVDGDLNKFKAEDKHRLELKPSLEAFWTGYVEDEYFDEEQERFFAVKTDKIK